MRPRSETLSGDLRRGLLRLVRDVALVVGLVLAGGAISRAQHGVGGEDSGGGTATRDAEGFLRASPGRPIELPRDHGQHPQTRTEWWYFTGPLRAADGRRFGFQATWFRQALIRDVAPGRSPLAVRDALLFHGALTDVDGDTFFLGEDASRAYPPWASASEERLAVQLLGNAVVDADGDGRQATLAFSAGEAVVRLELDLGASPVLLHGAEPGLSIKGHEPGQASWYYTLPRIPVQGTVELPGTEALSVTGTAWFDHEFGSGQLDGSQVGWDWFAVPLDAGGELMVYRLRLSDGSADTTSSGTWRHPDGRIRHLGHDDVSVRATGSWTSPRSGVAYPSGWVLEVPGEALELTVTPLLADQEQETPRTTGVTYWEGLCRFEGQLAGEAVGGDGYVELVGYADSLGERLSSEGAPERP